MILVMSLDLAPSFKTSIEAKVKGLVFNVDYLENQCCNFIQKNYGRKKTSADHTRFVFWTVIFCFAWNIYTFDDS